MSRTAASTTPPPLTVDQGLFVYGVIEASARLPGGLTGLDDSRLQTVEHGRVAAVVAPMTLERPPGRRVDLLAYSGTLDAIAERVPVVPVQFGSVLPDEGSIVEELLAPGEATLSVMLEELQGRAQFTFQARYLEPVVLSEIVAADPEIRELRRLTRGLPETAAYGERVRLGELVARALEQKRLTDAQLLLDMVLPHTVAHVVRPGAGIERLLDASLLVDHDRRGMFEDALETLAEGVHERIRLRLMGPMAPYDFVGDY